MGGLLRLASGIARQGDRHAGEDVTVKTRGPTIKPGDRIPGDTGDTFAAAIESRIFTREPDPDRPGKYLFRWTPPPVPRSQPKQEAVRRAFAALWPDGNGRNFKPTNVRDARVQKWCRENGLPVPSNETIKLVCRDNG
jgi:hypothetical protein